MSHPLVYELNARCWLRDLSDRHDRPITLETVPREEFQSWLQLGVTHLWLMGVWPTGDLSRQHAVEHRDAIVAECGMSDVWSAGDLVGSPYAVANYTVARELGGAKGLQQFRTLLGEHGILLVLDAILNHVGLDHRWVFERSELFVESSRTLPETWAHPQQRKRKWFAHGKDPNFPAWGDTIQLDYRNKPARTAAIETLLAIAEQCDGVRCDMAMLLLNNVFQATWKGFPGDGVIPQTEFWEEAISAVRQTNPDFLFLGEVYWGLEQRLQDLGFDYTYDKELYDLLVRGDGPRVQAHLLGQSPDNLCCSVHFLENHDERRAAEVFCIEEHKAAALLILALPGARLLHDGQLTGRRLKTPVQFGHYAPETPHPDLATFYERLLGILGRSLVGRGAGTLLEPGAAWPGNPTANCVVLVQWNDSRQPFELVVVNLADHRSQCYASLTVPDLVCHDWSMRDLLGVEEHRRFGEELDRQGVYLDVPAHGAQLFRFEPLE